MDVEAAITKASDTWRKRVLWFLFSGSVTLLVSTAVLMVFLLAAGYMPSAWMVFTITTGNVLVTALVWALIITAASAGKGRGTPKTDKWFALVRERGLPIATAFLLFLLPVITGTLIMLASAVAGGWYVFVGVAVFLAGLIGSILLVLTPYYAMKGDWPEALAKSFGTVKNNFLPVLLVTLFFWALLAVAASLPAPVDVAVQFLFLYPLVALTYLNIVK